MVCSFREFFLIPTRFSFAGVIAMRTSHKKSHHCQGGEFLNRRVKNGTSPDALTKWRVAMIARTSPSNEISVSVGMHSQGQANNT
jgi:hypothetical protein